MKITISNAKYLAAINTVIDPKETRFALTGVLIEKHREKGLVLVGTDGARLLVIHDEDGTVTEGQLGASGVLVRIERQPKAELKKVMNLDAPVTLEFNEDKASLPGSVTVCIAGTTIKDGGALLDLKYPDWLSIFPTELVHGSAPSTFDVTLLADFGKIGAYLKRKEVTPIVLIQDAPLAKAVVLFPTLPYVLRLIMPFRFRATSPVPTKLPAWLAEAPKRKKRKTRKAAK